MSSERPPAPPEGGPIVQLCTFRIGEEDYAVDIMRVREIVHPQPVTPVPRAPEFVDGVIRLHGEVISIVDARRRFGLPPRVPSKKTRFLILNVAGRRLGLVVDEVCEVLRVPLSELRPAPALVGQVGPRFFLGVHGGEPGSAGRPGGPRLRLLLNVKALLDPVRKGEAEAAQALAAAVREGAP
jgi:purine-binding chemotaxis protein CheW